LADTVFIGRRRRQQQQQQQQQQQHNIPLHVPKYVSYSHDNLHLSTGHSLAAAASTPPSAPSGFALMLQLHHIFEQI